MRTSHVHRSPARYAGWLLSCLGSTPLRGTRTVRTKITNKIMMIKRTVAQDPLRIPTYGHSAVQPLRYKLILLQIEDNSLICGHSFFSSPPFLLQILSGRVPYYYRKNDVQVLCEIMRGMKPLREQMRPEYPSISPKIWNFLQACWNEDPLGRPSVSQVNKMMRGFLREQRRMGMIFENESYIDMSAS